MVECLRKVDQDDELYASMLSQRALLNADYLEELYSNFEKFLVHIFSMPLEDARRRPQSATVNNYYINLRRESVEIDDSCRKRLFRRLFQ